MQSENKSPIPEVSNNIRKTTFEKNILPVLKYIGLIGAIIMAIVYFVIVVVMIVGFEIHNSTQTIVFAVVNAIVGTMIMQMLKIQGISFAKDLPENKAISDRYYAKETKDKKYVSIKRYWVSTVIKDVLIKGCSLAITTAGLIYIVVQGSEDMNLLLMAIANLLMFTCFGLLALNGAYEFYNTRHVPYMQHQLDLMDKKEYNNNNNKEEELQCSQTKTE